jgi:hypothetical protein
MAADAAWLKKRATFGKIVSIDARSGAQSRRGRAGVVRLGQPRAGEIGAPRLHPVGKLIDLFNAQYVGFEH